MKRTQGTLVFLSALLIGVGFQISAPRRSAAQSTGHTVYPVLAGHGGTATGPNTNGRNQAPASSNNGRWSSGDRNNGQRRHTPPDRGQNMDREGRGDRCDRNDHSSGAYGGWGDLYPYGYSAPPDAGRGSPRDAGYFDGFNAGRFDRVQGNLYNPRQYERSGNPDYFQGFVDGYEDGFRQ